MNRACFPKEKTPEFTKIGEIHELFVLALSLVWFAGATPHFIRGKELAGGQVLGRGLDGGTPREKKEFPLKMVRAKR